MSRPFETEILIDPDGTVAFRNLTPELREIAGLLAPRDPRLSEESEHARAQRSD